MDPWPEHPRLLGVRAKIARAERLIEELNQTADAWFANSDPPVFDTTSGSEWDVVRLRIKERVPPSVAVIAGDIAHNLRSALDHLVFELVDSICGRPTSRTAFPVCLRRNDFRRQVLQPLRSGKSGPLTGIPVTHDCVSVIEAHQPFARTASTGGELPEDDALAFLTSLSNLDKHRTLHMVFLVLAATEAEVPQLFRFDSEAVLLETRVSAHANASWLEDGCEIARFRFDRNETARRVQPRGSVPAVMMIGNAHAAPKPSVRIGLQGWEPMLIRISEAVRDLAPYLSTPQPRRRPDRFYDERG